MDPKTFMRSIEEQLRRVKSQYLQMLRSGKSSDSSSEEVLNNAKIWFLRTLQNTDLKYEDMLLPAADFVAVESFSRQRISPYGLMYPSVVWLISTLPKEQVTEIFGSIFYERIQDVARSFPTGNTKEDYSGTRS